MSDNPGNVTTQSALGIDFGDIFDTFIDFIPSVESLVSGTDNFFGSNVPNVPPAVALPAQNGRGSVCAPQTLPLQQVTRASCPPGFVAVDTNNDGVTDACMRKEDAIRCRLWKAKPKPVVTAAEGRILRKAVGVTRKIKRVAKMAEKISRGSIFPARR